MRDIYEAANSVWIWIGGESVVAEMGLHNLYLRANSKQRSEIFTEGCPNARLDEVMELQSEAA
jgi:hypothetical protein